MLVVHARPQLQAAEQAGVHQLGQGAVHRRPADVEPLALHVLEEPIGVEVVVPAENEADRASLYQQAETQLDKDSAIVPVYYRVSVRLVKPWVGGFTGHDPQDMTDLKYYFIKKH